MDLYSPKIIGWSLREKLTKEIVIATLDMAIKQRKLSVGLLLHLRPVVANMPANYTRNY